MTTLNHDDIRWRVSNTWDKGSVKWGMLVGYIDSRTAMEALDALDPNWSSKMEPITLSGEHGIRCTLIVNGVAREDVGVASNTEPLKGAFSDALKRAAVHFGVGRELYELPKIAVECEIGNNGKVKGPKALPVYRNGRWDIDRKVGWVKYDREPDEQPERGERAPQAGRREAHQPATTPAPAQYRRQELAELLHEKGLGQSDALRYAAIVGIPDTERPMTDESMDKLIDAIRGHGVGAPIETPAARVGGEETAGDVPPDSAVPPKPRTPEYGALTPVEKAKARAYWADPPEEPNLAEQLTVGAA